jgi:hypothetical protein
MDEVNVFMIGLGGGILGGAMVIWNYYMFICAKTKQYLSAKRFLKETLRVAGLEQEVHDMKQILRALEMEYNKNARKH